MSRRHAGSFSYKDVELGKLLPSNVDSPQLAAFAGSTSQAPALRPLRRPSGLQSSSSMSSISQDGTIRPSNSVTSLTKFDTHSRQSSTGSALAFGSYAPSPMLRAPPDIVTNTSTLVDKEALEAMQIAVQVAPSVWSMTDEMLDESEETKEDLVEMLDKAKTVTDKLRNSIRAVENGDALSDRKTLRDDAHVFANVSSSLLPQTRAVSLVTTYRCAPSIHRSSSSCSTQSSPMAHPTPYRPTSETVW